MLADESSARDVLGNGGGGRGGFSSFVVFLGGRLSATKA